MACSLISGSRGIPIVFKQDIFEWLRSRGFLIMGKGTTEKFLDHVCFVHPSTDISVNILPDISVECRSTY